jgi:cell division protein FtsQ
MRSVLGSLVVGILLGSAAFVGYEAHSRPIASVRVAGDLEHTSRRALEEAVAPHVTTSLYAVDVNAVRAAAESLPWVREARVRRVWPDGLQIEVVEREPIARWGEALVEASGQRFVPGGIEAFTDLPEFAGPVESTEPMLRTYLGLQAELRPAGFEISRLALDERHAWRVELRGGTVLKLGQQEGLEAVQRLMRAFEMVLGRRLTDAESVDLRYTNGFSVRWRREAPAAESTAGEEEHG